MVQAKKTTSAAFGDILAGLDSPQRGPAARGASAPPSPSGPSIDVSWIKSAQARARAAQMAQQSAESEKEPEKAPDPAHRSRRNLGGIAWGWRGASGSRSASYGQDLAGEEANGSPAANATGTSDIAEAAAANEAGVTQHPVHALRRLLSQIPWGWWRVEGAAATGAPAAPAIEPPPKSEDEAIAEELGLRADLAIVDLRRIRRDFAKKNHPDRFEPSLRVGAARRMTIVNMLIDAQMKRRPPSN